MVISFRKLLMLKFSFCSNADVKMKIFEEKNIRINTENAFTYFY